jgi:hypothetical protein
MVVRMAHRFKLLPAEHAASTILQFYGVCPFAHALLAQTQLSESLGMQRVVSELK